jgi:hypothetical protein
MAAKSAREFIVYLRCSCHEAIDKAAGRKVLNNAVPALSCGKI